VIPALAEERRVIGPDLRGFGWSEAPAGRLPALSEGAGAGQALPRPWGAPRGR